MKKLILVLALSLTSVVHADPVPVNDLRVVLNELASLISDAKIPILNSIEAGPVGSCGRNSPAYYTLSVKQTWNAEACKVTFLVAASDGNCMGTAARVARISQLPACLDPFFGTK